MVDNSWKARMCVYTPCLSRCSTCFKTASAREGLGQLDCISGAQIVERVHVSQRYGALLRDGQQVVTLPFEIAAGIVGNDPVWRTEVVRLCAGDRLDRFRTSIHVADNPLLSLFPLRAAQFDMAVRVVFEFVASTHQLLGRVDACDSNILFVTPFSPGLRGESPSHDKERRLDAIFVEHVEQARTGVPALSAKQNIGPRAIVKRQCNQLVG